MHITTIHSGASESELAAASFLARYRGATRDLYRTDLRILFQWCSDHGVDPLSVERAHLEFFIRYLEDERGNKAASVARRVSTIKSFYALAEADDRIKKSPARYLRKPKVFYDDTRALGLSRQEMSQLIHTARASDPMDDALISVMAVLALRVSEACSIRVEDFQDTERGHRVLRIVGKGNKPATIPLPVPVLRSLERAAGGRDSGPLLVRRDGEALDRRTAYRWVKRIAKKAGVTNRIYPHALRHGAITAALDAGTTLRDAQTYARHSDPRLTARYDRARGNLDKHAAYNVSGYLSGGSW